MLDAAGVPGLAVGTVKDGKPGWVRGFGITAKEGGRPVDGNTLFHAASLTKQATAHAAHTLRLQGKLDFGRPLVSYVDGLTDAQARKVTIAHVLSHSAGFPNWRFEPGQPLVSAFEPGSRWQYSGEGYVYLQRAMECVTGKGFGELIGELVFQPLGMTGSTILPLAENQPRLALPHNRRGEILPRRNLTSQAFVDFARSRNRKVESLTYEEAMACIKEAGLREIPDSVLPNAAASMVTCAADYARFVAAAIRTPELTKQQVRIRQGNGFDIGWGLGWGTERSGTREFLWQWGDNGGYKNIVFAEPARGEAIFVFTNGDNGARVYQRVLAEFAGFDHPAVFLI